MSQPVCKGKQDLPCLSVPDVYGGGQFEDECGLCNGGE
jgi:hypothetical protein